MKPDLKDLLAHMEDFDNEELEGQEWNDHMSEAVRNYNSEHGELWDPSNCIFVYLNLKIKKINDEPTE